MPTSRKSISARAAAALIICDIINAENNLTRLLPEYQQRLLKPTDQSFLQALCYGVFRHYYRLDFIATQLLSKPLKARDQDIHALLLLGLLQLSELRTPPHAAVSATVAACNDLGKSWAKKLVNAILRNYQRDSERLQELIDTNSQAHYECPSWLLERLQRDYPNGWQAIAAANNCHPSMTLRVNHRLISTEDYSARLTAAGIKTEPLPFASTALQLQQPMDVEKLPGFSDGQVSVQDLAAQLACSLLQPRPSDRILDACAAPGGKLAHLLEQCDADTEVLALENNPQRFEQLQQTLGRLQLTATVKLADAGVIDDWWDKQPFDSIMLDAPCTATGVIRRHPDIKVLRQQSDLQRAQTLQAHLLAALWPLLASGGKLLYITCSLLTEENDQQIERLLSEHTDARSVPIDAPWGQITEFGRQILPGEQSMDGFYYACVEKT